MPTPQTTAVVGAAATAVGGPLLGTIVALFMQYGFPATVKVLNNWATKKDRDPTPEEIRSIMDGIKRPEDY